jgi:dsRNA-specific ribonuclease
MKKNQNSLNQSAHSHHSGVEFFESKAYEKELLSFALEIGYGLNDYGLLKEALTHRSFSNEKKLGYDNQRLEFLGDAVVNLVTANELMQFMKGSDEGNLSNARARIVNEYCLAKMSELAGIDRLLRVGKGESRLGDKAKLVRLADAFESVSAAIYSDLGYQVVYDWVWSILKIPFLVLLEQGYLSDAKIAEIAELTHAQIDIRMRNLEDASESKSQFQTLKTQLQEKLQSLYHDNPTYISEPLPKQKYAYRIYIKDRLLAQAQGNTIKSAEWEAVKKAWQLIHSPEFDI